MRIILDTDVFSPNSFSEALSINITESISAH